MSKAALTIRKWTMLIHRWMGIVFCVLFFTWFASGIVMMYCRFPRVEPEQRLNRSAVLVPDTVSITPAEAFRATHAPARPSQIRLTLLDGHPVYRFSFGKKSTILVFADTGQQVSTIGQPMALRIASTWIKLPAAVASFQGLITKPDQWTVDSSVRPYGPFWKYSWPNGEEVYVSQQTGEIVQDTTRASRIAAYFGAIPHWLYFTWLLGNGPLWSRVVIWLSGAGTVMSLLGIVAGVWLYSPSKRYRYEASASSIPFAGPKHWHVFLGLIFGVVTCTWIFSGLMSMGPFDWLIDPEQPNLDQALHGTQLDPFAFEDPRAAIAASGLQAKELELFSFAGQPFYLVTQSPRQSRIVSRQGSSQTAFAPYQILTAVRQAIAPATLTAARLVKEYELYYIDRQNRQPLPVLYVQLNDPAQSAYYIDPRKGRVVESYGARSRWNRWLYHGLHSIDLPWLYAHRPAWDIVVLVLMLGGSALSVTAIVIAWKAFRRKFFTIDAEKSADIPHSRQPRP